VMLLYLDLVANGARVIKNGQRSVVDHLKRRDLSIFRIGLYFRERRLANDLPFTIRLLPLICKNIQVARRHYFLNKFNK
jgi:hypothetical protein